MTSSERGEHIRITAPFEKVSERKYTLHVLNINDGTRNKIPDEASELSVPDTRFDRQPHTHHTFVFTLFSKPFNFWDFELQKH